MSPSLTTDPTLERGEYTRRTGTRRQADAKPSRVTGRLRLLFFGVASLWGFLMGALTIGVAVKLAGIVERFDPWVVVALVPGAGLALAGGAAAASAYREARRRHSR